MKKGLLIAVGAIVALAGLLFTLQGLNVLGGSAMSGKTVWAVLGPVILIVGLVIATVAARRSSGVAGS